MCTHHAKPKFIKEQNNKPCNGQHHHFALDVVLATPLFSPVTPLFWVVVLGSTTAELFASTAAVLRTPILFSFILHYFYKYIQ